MPSVITPCGGGSGGGGIQFDTFPQDGTYLYLKTTGVGGGPSAKGLEIHDTGNGILIDTQRNLQLAANFSFSVVANSGIDLESQTTFFASADAGDFQVKVGTQDANGYKFAIVDAAGLPVLTVKWDGVSAWEYHGKVGGIWLFDL